MYVPVKQISVDSCSRVFLPVTVPESSAKYQGMVESSFSGLSGLA